MAESDVRAMLLITPSDNPCPTPHSPGFIC